jgi:two-component system chemotaxis response regulator CheB
VSLADKGGYAVRESQIPVPPSPGFQPNVSMDSAKDRSWWSLGAEPSFEVVALAASAGGFSALRHVLAGLRADFPAAVLVAQHWAGPLYLQIELLGRCTGLQVKQAEEGESLRPATVFVAPAGRHLLITPGGGVCVSQSERVGFVRPSADLLFESVASRYAERVIAVVLTGRGADGARGVRAVRRRGGFVIAQDAATAAHFDMPAAAIETRKVDLVLPLDHIPFALETLVGL